MLREVPWTVICIIIIIIIIIILLGPTVKRPVPDPQAVSSLDKQLYVCMCVFMYLFKNS